MSDRRLYAVSGADRFSFLQGLVSNDVLGLKMGAGIVYAALLSPQGKYLADFFIVQQAGAGHLILDLPQVIAAPTMTRLTMYRLRADVTFAPLDMAVARGLGPVPDGAFADPRDAALGWRDYGIGGGDQIGAEAWLALRVAHTIPETGAELVPNETYLLEAGFERLHGVDFRKGCYVGQEVTARMKHKTELRKGLVRVAITGAAPIGTPILTADGREAGVLYSQQGGHALAHLRFDRMDGPLFAASAEISPLP